MECLLTVVLTVYNVEKYIDMALESLSKQSYNKFQLIIVNDGSTDESLRLIDTWKDRFSDITIINQQNKGVSAARNNGMNQARGKYILFLDSDDLYERDMLETLLTLITDYNADIAACGYNIIEDNNIKMLNSHLNKEINEVLSSEQLNEFLTHRKINGYVWNKLFRLEFLTSNNIRFIEGKIYEDTIMIFEALLKRPKYIYTNKKLYNYIKRKGSITTLSDNKSVIKLFENAEIVSNKLKDLNLFEELKNEYDYFEKLLYMQVLIQSNLNKIATGNNTNLTFNEKEISDKLDYKNKYLTLRDKVYIFILKNNLFKIYFSLFKNKR